MDKILILIAGMPGTGKTRFADYLSKEMKIVLICKDRIKEIIWDKVRYNTDVRSESKTYGALAYDISYHFCEKLMVSGQPIIFESNFTQPRPDFFADMVKKYHYKVITVLFNGDIEVIHKRFTNRDVTSERHPGLVSSGFYSDFERFKDFTQPCRDFNFGDFILTVDTTDFSKVSYSGIIKRIAEEIDKIYL